MNIEPNEILNALGGFVVILLFAGLAITARKNKKKNVVDGSGSSNPPKNGSETDTK